MNEAHLADEVRALKMAWPGSRGLAAPGRALILIPKVRVGEGWSPGVVDGLLVADGWPDQRPQLLMDAVLERSGQAPPNFALQYLVDRAWYSFSFNAPWDPTFPHLVPAVRSWLGRFDGRP